MEKIEFDDFKRLYPLSKTLRFEARPTAETLENIRKNGLLNKDEHRAESYVKVKKLIDEYHKAFIDRVLKDGCFSIESLHDYYDCYRKKSAEEDAAKKFVEIQKNLREQITKTLKKDKAFGNINKKFENLINSDLVEFVKTATPRQLCSMSEEEAMQYIKEFNGFTTYFVGFSENRRNMYTAEEKSTGIAYRIVNENLPKFIDNMDAFSEIRNIPDMADNLKQLYRDIKPDVNSVDEIFSLGYYNKLLTQSQIDIYNAVIGGKTEQGKDIKCKGINEYVNLYNQNHPDAHLPKLKMLFKQILSDRDSISWLPEEFSSDNQVLQAVNDCFNRLSENVLGDKCLKLLLTSLGDYNPDGIFLRNNLQLNEISSAMFENWNCIRDAITKDIKEKKPRKPKESEEKYEKGIADIRKKADSFSIKYIDECLKKYNEENVDTIENYFARLGAVKTGQQKNLFVLIEDMYLQAQALLCTEYPDNRNLAQDKENVAKIKDLLDVMLELQHFVKPLLGKGNESGKDERFYGEITLLWNELATVTPLYDMVRNYMTRKPYSQEKIKINFDNSQLFGGWDENKEEDYGSILLRRNGKYYIAIMDKQSKNLLGKTMPTEGECYEKMVYKLLPGSKMFAKVFFSERWKDLYKPSERILKIRKNETYKKGEDFKIKDCHALIDFYKESLQKHDEWSQFGFHFSDTSTYNDINDFYNEAVPQAYKISFSKVSKEYIDGLVKDGKMYLFEIYNKDFSDYSHGTPNMHTLYWKALFDERNMEDTVYKLNGNAELFYRKKSIDNNRPTHPAGLPIKNKNGQNSKAESTFSYNLVKNRRYTEDKFLFHVPITMNFKSKGSDKINRQVIEYLKNVGDIHVIGIDRGERNLLYVVVTDMHGNIKEQLSLNNIVSGNNATDYHDLLDKREKEREKARESWQTIEGIKDLKEGYLSQAVHVITRLMLKYKAIVVLEDLNMGFMRSRQKFEKQVYQKFEKMLIEKLNYLVDKKADPAKPGGLLNAYQLTGKFESFNKLGKQSGFLFYVPAWNTSKIDPVTGFVNLFDTRYVNEEKAKEFFAKFKSIRYNASSDWFEFVFDYADFTQRAEGTRTQWTVCTKGSRIQAEKEGENSNGWKYTEKDITREFKDFFAEFEIDINGNLQKSIVLQNGKNFFERLLRLFGLVLQMRNSKPATGIDYLVSPVSDDGKRFFDSRDSDGSLPRDADANGAYNIARKGMMLVRQIKGADDLAKLKFDVSNKSWLNFAQQKPYLDE